MLPNKSAHHLFVAKGRFVSVVEVLYWVRHAHLQGGARQWKSLRAKSTFQSIACVAASCIRTAHCSSARFARSGVPWTKVARLREREALARVAYNQDHPGSVYISSYNHFKRSVTTPQRSLARPRIAVGALNPKSRERFSPACPLTWRWISHLAEHHRNRSRLTNSKLVEIFAKQSFARVTYI